MTAPSQTSGGGAEMIDDGGPAFPRTGLVGVEIRGQPGIQEYFREGNGLTIRDYFAAQFMARAQSLCERSDGSWDEDEVAACCYRMADAMIKAMREQT